MDLFLNDLMAENIAYSQRAGFNRGPKAQSEASDRVMDQLRTLEQQGRLPPGFEMPTMDDLRNRSVDVVQQHGGGKMLQKRFGAGETDPGAMLDRYNLTPERFQEGAAADDQR